MLRPACVLAVLLLAALPGSAAADSVVLNPTQDNTLIQRVDSSNQLSNGQGDVFVGRTNQDGQDAATISIRRGLLAFDVAASIPAGAAITSVTLTMRDVMGLNGDPTVSLHRVLQDWGEGNSFQNGGMGAAAQAGDATWYYRFFDVDDPAASPAWDNPGGDFSSTVTAQSIISDDNGPLQFFAWTSTNDPLLVADVQSWLDDPAGNFGWLLMGDESQGQTAKRLNSGESAVSPALLIEFQIPEPSGVVLGTLAAGALAAIGIRRRRALDVQPSADLARP